MPRLTKEQQHQLNMATHLAFFLVGLVLGALIIFMWTENEAINTQPFVSREVETGTAAELKKYTGNATGYTLVADKDYKVESTGDAGIASDVYMKNGDTFIQVQVLGDGAIDTSIPLSSYKFDRDRIAHTGGVTKLGGEDAYIFKDEGSSANDLPPVIIYVAKHNGSFVHLMFYGNKSLSKDQEKVLESFTFTK